MLYSTRLQKLRERQELTQKYVGSLINLDSGTYSNYENEKIIIPLIHLNTLCNYYNVSLDYIFSFSDNLNYVNINTEINSEIMGIRLKEIRKEKKFTQSKLASVLNTVQPVITNYEKGKHIIATPFLYTICKLYNVSADWLLGRVDSPKYLN